MSANLKSQILYQNINPLSDSTKNFGDEIDEKTKSYFHTAEAFSSSLTKKVKLNRNQQNSQRDLCFGIDLQSENLWLNIDKPAGFSSAKVVAIIKKITGAKKVGHGGTLDPFACGVLPVAINRATKTSEHLMNARKKYFFRVTWGEFRDSDDIDGKIEESSPTRPTTEKIISVLPFFIGKILQTPSRFSAIKIDGKRAYDLARKNIHFEMKKREIEIFSLKLILNSNEFAEFEVECSKGTYIRSLARGIATQLDVCGYVSKLLRLRVGKFLYEKRISLDELKLATRYGGRFSDGSLLLMQDVL